MTLRALITCTCVWFKDRSLTATCPWCEGRGIVVDPVPISEFVPADDGPAHENFLILGRVRPEDWPGN